MKTIIQTIPIKTIIQIDKHKVKYTITACIPKLLKKLFKLFSLLHIRMNGKNINFDNKNIKKSDFYNKNKKIFNIDNSDVNNSYNTLLGIMIMVLSDHYIYLFHKRLAILINLIKIK